MTTLANDDKRSTVLRATDPEGRFVRTARIGDSSIERRAAGEPIGFRGEAIVFNEWTWIGSKRWGFWERIAPEAVTQTLAEADVRFLRDHLPWMLLSRSSAGTLRLAADTRALNVDADMAPVSYAEDAAVLLERKELREMSFAFEPLSWEYTERDGEDAYTITEMRLYDVSIVTFPAYQSTSAGLRGAAFDALCRAAGLDAAAERRLMRELTGAPDPLLDVAPERAVELLRQIAGPGSADTAPPDTSGSADTARSDSPPADTTGTSQTTELARRHLAVATRLHEENI